MSPVEVAAALAVALMWGLQFVTSKLGATAIPPLLFVALRFAGVAMLLLPFAGRPSRREFRIAAILSVCFGSLCFGLFFSGLKLGSAGLSATLSQLMTPFALIFALPIAGERPDRRALLGVAIAFAGIAVALVDPSHRLSLVAALLVSGDAASQGLGTAVLRRAGPVPPMRLLAWLSLFAAPQLALASLLLEHGQAAALRHAPAVAWLALGYAIAVGAIAAFGLWFWLVGRLPLARVAPYALLQTVFGIAAGIVALHEPPAPALIVGSLICMAGVLLTQTAPPLPAASPGTTETARCIPSR